MMDDTMCNVSLGPVFSCYVFDNKRKKNPFQFCICYLLNIYSILDNKAFTYKTILNETIFQAKKIQFFTLKENVHVACQRIIYEKKKKRKNNQMGGASVGINFAKSFFFRCFCCCHMLWLYEILYSFIKLQIIFICLNTA